MGGPTSTVLLPEKLSESQWDELAATLRTISPNVEKGSIWNYEFQLTDTRPIGGTYVDAGLGRPMGLLEQEYRTGELTILKQKFHFEPRSTLQLDSMSNQREDHRAHGEVLCFLAEKYRGLIDFGGALLPPLPEEMYKRLARNGQGLWIFQEANWSDVSSYFDVMVRGIPGKIVSIEYRTANNRTWAHHITDTAFIRAWLQHPNFHVIK